MKEFVLQPVLSLSKTKYAEFLLEYYKGLETYLNIHLIWERKIDLAGLRLSLSIWRFNLRLTFFADKRAWSKEENQWVEGSEENF